MEIKMENKITNISAYPPTEYSNWNFTVTFENYNTRPFDKAYLRKDGSFEFMLGWEDYDFLTGHEQAKAEADYGDILRSYIKPQGEMQTLFNKLIATQGK